MVKDVEILGFDKNKIDKSLLMMGIEKKKSRKGDHTKNKWCYFGIKNKTEDDANINEELDDEED